MLFLCVFFTRLLLAWAAPSLAVRQAIHCATELHGTRFRFRVRGQGVQEREQVRRHRGTVAYRQDKAEVRTLQQGSVERGRARARSHTADIAGVTDAGDV